MKPTPTTSAPLIVGVGASAGGLEAFGELLQSLGNTKDLAIVFVQHLEKNRNELLVELLIQSTPMPVVQVSGQEKIEAGTVYVCPPWTLLELKNASLRIAEPENDKRPAAPVDHFLQSLADDQAERGVGVILSGTGSDGTLGLKAISDAGGMTFAQSSESAKYDSMPRSAATTGVADHVLAPSAIAAELQKYASYLAKIVDDIVETSSVKQIHDAIPTISKRLMEVTNHNFQHYKQNTLARRIRRRMQVLKLASVDAYVRILADDAEEPQALFRELLISVTEFFRDPSAFELLASTVIPKLFANRRPDEAVRIWVPGCATGEEAYSIAMLCREQMDQLETPPEVQIFATDIDDRALKICRQGIYPIGIEDDVSEERLKRFFIKRGKTFQVTQDLRELVLFSAHNLISDPPFSRLDLISCRNLLIYLGPHLQKKLIPLFHYALRPSGYLLLGPSENISSHGQLFRIVDAKHRLSQRKGTGVDATAALSMEEGGVNSGESIPAPSYAVSPTEDLMQVMQRIVLDEFAPKSVIVEEDGKILCTSADMHKYLTVGSGNFQNNIIKMARNGLRVGLRATLQEAKSKRRRIVHDDLSVRVDGNLQRVMLTVQPMPRVGEEAELFMVVFHDVGLPLVHGESAITLSADDVETTIRADSNADAIIVHLERELSSTRNDLERSIQEFETANEELKSSNEELISLNEEMQSANEELQTSKEEIQAAVDALERTNTDLENLLRSTQIATIFLDDELRIRSFTPAATAIYGLITSDVGRPLSQLMPLADYIPPLPDPKTVDGEGTIEHTIQTRDGRWFVRRVLPYRSHQKVRSGIVVTFNDVTAERLAHHQIRESESQLRSLISSTAEGIYGIDLEGNCTFANEACVHLLGYESAEELLNKQMHELAHHSHADGSIYPVEECRIYCAYLRGERVHADDEVYWRKDGSSLDVEYWSYPQLQDDRVVGCVVTFIDITERKKRERSLAFLAGLHARLAALTSAEAIIAEASQRIAEYMQVSHFLMLEMDKNAEQATVIADYCTDESRSLMGVYNMSEFATVDERQQLASGLAMVVNDTATSARPSEFAERFAALQVGSIINVPCTRDQQLEFVISVTKREARVWRDDEIDLLRQLANIIRLKLERAKAEVALRESEAKFRDLADNISQFAWMADAAGSIFWYNQRWFDYTGTTLESMQGWGWMSVHHPDHVDRVVEKVQKAWDTGEIWEDTFPLRSKDGEYRWFLSRAQPIRDASGNILRWFGTNTDITDAKKASEELQESQERLRLGVQVANFALAQIDYIANEVMLSAEAATLYGLGDCETKVTRKQIHETFHPDDREMLQQRIEESLQADGDGEMAIDHRIIRPDGEVRWLSIRKRIFFDNNTTHPRPKSGILAARDVTEQMHWEIDLAERESHLRRVINNQLGLVGVIDRHGNLVEVDDRSMDIAGLTRDDVIGKHFAECAWWTYDENVANEMREAMARAFAGKTVRYDVGLYAKGNQRLMIDFMIAPVFGDDGNVEFLVPSGVDISERKLAEEELEKARALAEAANQSKSEFLANMSHEIRTPMTAILGYTDLIAENLQDTESIEYVRTIRRNGDFLLDIINDILDLSKIEAGKFEVSQQLFSPQRLVEDVRSIMDVRASNRQIELEIDYRGPIPKQIESDPKRLRQVLINLVGNAIKFTPAGSVHIVVSYLEASQKLRFDVIDSGIGISDKQRRRLFQPFSQGDGNVNREFGGTGLGLAISKRLTEMLGGEISVESEIGKGSTFTVSIAAGNVKRFGLVNPSAEISDEQSSKIATEVRLDIHILVVDDRRDIRFLSKRLLTTAGATVDEAEDGEIAVATVAEAMNQGKTYDLVLLDMQMPKMDGYETAKALRHLGFTKPIVALTADAMQGDMTRCIECGCNDYLSKPIDKTLLLNLVKRLTS